MSDRFISALFKQSVTACRHCCMKLAQRTSKRPLQTQIINNWLIIITRHFMCY